jgi:hypothetical protein
MHPDASQVGKAPGSLLSHLVTQLLIAHTYTRIILSFSLIYHCLYSASPSPVVLFRLMHNAYTLVSFFLSPLLAACIAQVRVMLFSSVLCTYNRMILPFSLTYYCLHSTSPGHAVLFRLESDLPHNAGPSLFSVGKYTYHYLFLPYPCLYSASWNDAVLFRLESDLSFLFSASFHNARITSFIKYGQGKGLGTTSITSR